jgi:2-C-methyl-D-erythritol 4-phosphate cytidylyltransferase
MAAHSQSTVAAILVAAGSGERLGADVPKAFVEIAGQTLLQHAMSRFVEHCAVRDVIVVVPPQYDASFSDVTTVPGGVTRQESVAAGLRAVDGDIEFVLVHDVARPFVPVQVIDAVVGALREGAEAVVPVVPIHDTVRRVDTDGMLTGVVDRSTLVAVQTPQGFRRDVLVAAYAAAAGAVTDDAALVEALGHQIVAVPGDESAFKITTPADLARAESLSGGMS